MGYLGIEPPKTRTERKDRWSPEQQKLFKNLYKYAKGGFTGEGAPISPDMFLPQTGMEGQYLDLVGQLAKSRAARGQPLYDVGPEWADKYFTESIKPLYMEEWQDVALPAIERAYAGPNFYSSARQEATREAGQDLALELAAKRAELQYGEELQRRQALDTAFGQQQDVIARTQEAGQLTREIGQEEVMSNLQKFLMGEQVQVGTDRNGRPIYSSQPANNPAIQMALQLLGLDPYVYVTKSTGGDLGYQTFPKFMGGFGQGLGQAIGSMAGKKSDRRLKKDIVYWTH